MTDHYTSSYLCGNFISSPSVHWLHIRYRRDLCLAFEDVVLLQYAQAEIAQQFAFVGDDGSVAGDLVSGVNLIQGCPISGGESKAAVRGLYKCSFVASRNTMTEHTF